MNYIIPNKQKHQYIIGIDFGHGETSVALCRILWDDKFSVVERNPPKDVKIFPGKYNAIHSVLLIESQYDDDGKIIQVTKYIGSAAESRYKKLINNDKIERDFFASFKDKPSKMSCRDKKGMKLFMEEVYKKVLNDDDGLKEGNHLVFIACPSNSEEWTETEKADYAKLALDAGLPLVKLDDNITGIIRESRAAFISVRYNEDNNIKTGIDDGILLIDCGSSTFDLTYYSRSLSKPIDYGYKIGASEVEQTLLRHLRENRKDLESAIQINEDNNKTSAEFELRRKKEDFYSDCLDALEVSLSLTSLTGGKIEGWVEEQICEDDFNTMLSHYKIKIEEKFSDFKDNHIPNKKIKIIFLTGGASQMSFIKDIAKDVFGKDIPFAGKNDDPSTIISRGIALAGRADLRTYNMGKELLDKPFVNNADIASHALDEASSSIAKKIIKNIEKVYTQFVSATNGTVETTINSLEEKLRTEINAIDFSSFLNTAYTNTLISVNNDEIIPKINNVVHDYYPTFNIPPINTEKKFSLASDAKGLRTLTTMISSCLDQIIEGFIEGFAKLIWNIFAGTIAGVEAVLVNLGKGVVNLFKDKNDKLEYEDVGEWVDIVTIDFRDKNTKLSSSKRLKVKNYFNEHKHTYESNLRSEIHSTLKSDKQLITLINNSGREEIKKYIKDQIDSARLMLN